MNRMSLILRCLCVAAVVATSQAVKTYGCFGSVSETEYRILHDLIDGTYKVPVKERTSTERALIRRYSRVRQNLEVIDNKIYYNGKGLLHEKKCKYVVKETFTKCKGSGIRRVYHILKRKYSGITEKMVQAELNKLPEYQKKNLKFKNKATLKHVTSDNVHDALQIDLVDMSRDPVVHKKIKCKYILSVLDIFSRFVWLRPLPNKSAIAVMKQLKIIFSEFGKPKIIQHDCGKEFGGQVKRLLQKLQIKDIKSRPYHPQSQGKVERMHKHLKQKIAFDISNVNKFGVNWAKRLPVYQNILNNEPKECLAWRSPYEVYYGRNLTNKADSSSCTRKQIRKIRDDAQAATFRLNKRNDKPVQTTTYKINERVMVRYKPKGSLNKKKFVVDGFIRNKNKNMYEVEFKLPKENTSKKEWLNVTDIATLPTECAKKISGNHKQHYYIQKTKASSLRDLQSEFGLDIGYNPPGNGNCQFSAIAFQLNNIGVFRSEATLRNDVISFLRRSSFWHESITESPTNYLFRMGQNAEYGDHITLQAISNIYNAQILVVSTLNSRTTLISPNGLPDGEVNDNLPMIVLGHYPEGEGEHYVALSYDKEIVRNIIYESEQIYFGETNSDPDSNNDTENLPSDIDTANDNLDNNPTDNLPSDIDTANDNLDNNATDNLPSDIDTANDNLDNNATDNLSSHIDTANDNLDNNDTENLPSDIDTANDNLNNNATDNLPSDIDTANDNLDNNATDNLPSDIDTANDSLDNNGTENLPNDIDTANDLNNDIISLRSLVENIRRRRRPIAQSSFIFSNLPLLIQVKIVRYCIYENPAMRYVLRRCHLSSVVQLCDINLPRIYISPDIMQDVPNVVSVRRLLLNFGRFSGLILEIRNIIRESRWANAWLHLQLCTDAICWYEIADIWYRRP